MLLKRNKWVNFIKKGRTIVGPFFVLIELTDRWLSSFWPNNTDMLNLGG
jgi:hypothetical protein